MRDQPQSKIIGDNPIEHGLDSFRSSFKLVCEDRSVSCTPDALGQLGQEDLQDLELSLLSALQILSVARLLPSSTGRGTLRNDLSRLNSAVNSDNFHFDQIKPLLDAVLADKPDNDI